MLELSALLCSDAGAVVGCWLGMCLHEVLIALIQLKLLIGQASTSAGVVSSLDALAAPCYPARACAARGKVISRGWWCPYVKNLQFFWNQSFKVLTFRALFQHRQASHRI